MSLPVYSRDRLTAADYAVVRRDAESSDRDGLVALNELQASVQTLNPDTTHAIPIASGTVIMTKASASAFTLAAPTAAQNGTRMIFLNNTANAHVITATGLLQDGVTGGAKNSATFGAFLGASLTLQAYNGTWFVESKNVCTIA